ncbi:hypothetical protein D3C87_687460 [compost metagenome]
MTTELVTQILRTEAKRAQADINLRTKQLETKNNFSQAVSARLAANAAVKKIEAAVLDLQTAERIINVLTKGA